MALKSEDHTYTLEPEILAEVLKPDGAYTVGYAFFFDNIVVFGGRELKEAFRVVLVFCNGKKDTGTFLGVARCVIPQDKYRVTYQWLKHTKGFIKREHERAVLKNLKLTRGRMKLMKVRGQKELK